MMDSKPELKEVASDLAKLAKVGGAEHVLVLLLGPTNAPPMVELGALIDGNVAELISALLHTLLETIPHEEVVAALQIAALSLNRQPQPPETIN